MIGGGVTLVFVFLGWRWNRRTQGGKMTFSFIARLLVYTFGLVLGEIYLILLVADLGWPRAPRFVALVSWGVLLGSVVSLASFDP